MKETASRRKDDRKRARMLPILAIIFLSQQFSFFARRGDIGSRTVDHVQISAWLVLSIVLLLALATGGFWFRPRKVRALMDDEPTRANRTEAFRIGFLATMAAAILLYFISLFGRWRPRGDPILMSSASPRHCCASISRTAGLRNEGGVRTAQRVRAERDPHQAALAEMVGVSRKTINTIENQVFVPSTLLALKLARALG